MTSSHLKRLSSTSRAAGSRLLCLVVPFFGLGDVCRQYRLEPLSGSAPPNPAMSSGNGASQMFRKFCCAKFQTFVPRHAKRLPRKIKCAMCKIILAKSYAMRKVEPCPTQHHSPQDKPQKLEKHGMLILRLSLRKKSDHTASSASAEKIPVTIS